MPARSKSQQQAAGAALAAKRGETPVSELRDAAKSMYKMSVKDLEDFAGTETKGLPEKVKQKAFHRVVNKISKAQKGKRFRVR